MKFLMQTRRRGWEMELCCFTQDFIRCLIRSSASSLIMCTITTFFGHAEFVADKLKDLTKSTMLVSSEPPWFERENRRQKCRVSRLVCSNAKNQVFLYDYKKL